MTVYRIRSLVPIVVLVLAGLFLAFRVIPQANVLWDEAVYLGWIYRIHQAIVSGQFSTLSDLTYRQFEYPPLQSYVLAALLLPFGFTIGAARLSNLLLFLVTGWFVYDTAKRLGNRSHEPFAGYIAVLLYASSPLLLYLASVAYKETGGMLILLLTLRSYAAFRRSPTPLRLVTVAGLLAAAFFWKYHYGVFLVPVILTEAVIHLIERKDIVRTALRYTIITLPSVLLLLLFIVIPGRFGQFTYTLNNPYRYMDDMVSRMDGLLFYPRGLYFAFALNHVTGVLLIISLVGGLVFTKTVELRSYWLLLFFTLALLTPHTTNLQERYLATALPGLFIIADVLVVRIAAWVKRLLRTPFPTYASVAFLIGGVIILTLPTLPGRIYGASAKSVHSLTFDQTDYRDVWLEYNPSKWPQLLPKAGQERALDVAEFIARTVHPDRTIEYVGASGEFSPPYYDLSIDLSAHERSIISAPYRSYVVTTEIFTTSRYYTLDYQKINLWRIQGLGEVKTDTGLEKIDERMFSDLGVRVAVYGNRE